MKTPHHIVTALVAILTTCSFLQTSYAQDQTQTENPPPFFVRLKQEYKYPGTELTSTAGMIEQVVGEELSDYVLSTPIGITVRVPKAIVTRIPDREAADGLIAERVTTGDQMKQMGDYISKMQVAYQALQTERDQMLQAIQMAVAARQQQSSGSSAQYTRDEIKALMEIQEMMKKKNSR